MAGPSPFKSELVKVAKDEHERLGSLKRGDAALRERIELYCRDVNVAMTDAVDKFHYSAVFISWCLRKAGASEEEFPATSRHWEYARRATQDPIGTEGILRGRTIESYAPQVGDLVHMNRDGGIVGYERARSGPYPYLAESGIVIHVGESEREALIVMGNQEPRGNVGTEQLVLSDSGLLVQRTKAPFICVLEVLK